MKKAFLLLALLLFFSAPPVILYFSMQNSLSQLQKEHQKQQFKMLNDQLKSFDQLANPIMELYRDLFLLLRRIGDNDLKPDSLDNVNDRLFNYLKNKMFEFSWEKSFKTHSSLIYQKNGVDAALTIPQDGGTQSRWLEKMSFSLREIQKKFIQSRKFRDLENLKTLLVKEAGGFINLSFLRPDGDGERSQRSVIRSESELKLLVFLRFTNALLLNFSFDLSDYTTEKQLMRKIRSHKTPDYGIMVLISKTGKILAKSDFFKENSILQKRLAKLFENGSEKNLNIVLDDFLVSVSANDPKKTFRTILTCRNPVAGKNMPMQLVIAFMAIAGCFCFKASCEHFLMDRHLQLSVTLFIVVIFISVALLPLLSSLYLAGEYIVSNFRIARTEVFENLEKDLKEMDYSTFATLKNTVNTIKSLDSIEAIASFTKVSPTASTEVFFLEMLNQLRKSDKRHRSSELWIYEPDKEIFGYKFLHDFDKYSKTRNQNAILSEIFIPKFKQFMGIGKEAQTVSDKKHNSIEVESLRAEMFDSFILNLFGDKTYYSVRENFNHLMKFESLLESNAVLNMPVSHNGKTRFILTWVFTSKDMRDMFPLERLNSKAAKPTVCIFGNDQYMGGAPEHINKLSQIHPDIIKVARQAHLTSTRLVTQDTSAPGSPIYEATPARYSDFIIAGKRFPPALSSITSDLVGNAIKIFIVVCTSGLLLAFLTSLYFTLPIRRLIEATRQIISENYSFRLETRQPDEFSTVAKAFNEMAAGLEEGRLLSRFVSKSVQEIAAQGDDSMNTAKLSEATVLFSSIKDFNKIQQGMSPEKAFEILQAHLSAAVESIRIYGGEIDKMIEDKVMIVFTRETGSINPEAAAARTAFNIRKLLKERFNLAISAGINSGEVISGVMGAANVRLSKTVIGDTVNLAARLAYLASNFPEGSIVAEKKTIDALPLSFKCKKLDISSVKGKTHSVEAYQIEEAVQHE